MSSLLPLWHFEESSCELLLDGQSKSCVTQLPCDKTFGFHWRWERWMFTRKKGKPKQLTCQPSPCGRMNLNTTTEMEAGVQSPLLWEGLHLHSTEGLHLKPDACNSHNACNLHATHFTLQTENKELPGGKHMANVMSDCNLRKTGCKKCIHA